MTITDRHGNAVSFQDRGAVIARRPLAPGADAARLRRPR